MESLGQGNCVTLGTCQLPLCQGNQAFGALLCLKCFAPEREWCDKDCPSIGKQGVCDVCVQMSSKVFLLRILLRSVKTHIGKQQKLQLKQGSS